MKLTIHRGAAQIGGSCIELQATDGSRLLLDMGMPLTMPDGSDWPRGTAVRPTSELIAEGVLPPVGGLLGDAPPIDALIVSHAHMDHHGLAHHVPARVPVYGSRGTCALLRVSQLFVPDATLPADLRELPTDSPLSLRGFHITAIPVDHASPDSRALLVEADGQRLLYSGDVRLHGRLPELAEGLYERAPVDILLLEGTTVGQPSGSHGFSDEQAVEASLEQLLRQNRTFVSVIASGQNADRAVSVYNAAVAAGRELMMDAYQAFVFDALREIRPDLPQFDSPGVRVKFVRNHVRVLKDAGHWSLTCAMSRAAKVTTEQIEADPSGFVYLARGSAATVSLLRRLTRSMDPVLVWSQWAGYLERGGPIQKFCSDNGIQPILIHSGGHASPSDLADIIRRMQPKVVVPIHSESPERFSELFPRVVQVADRKTIDLGELINTAQPFRRA